MIIDTNSWHYKLLFQWGVSDQYSPMTSCAYIRKVIMTLIITICCASALVFALGFFILLMISTVVHLFTGPSLATLISVPPIDFWDICAVGGMLLWSAVIVVGLLGGVSHLYKLWLYNKHHSYHTTQEKKDPKFCSFVEYK